MSRERVHPVLGHVDIERAEVDGRQRVERLEHGRKVVGLVGAEHLRRRVAVAGERVTIDSRQFLDRDHVLRRIEVVQVGGKDAARVPQLAIRVDDPRQDLFADAQLLA
jgi:hypothetical protein